MLCCALQTLRSLGLNCDLLVVRTSDELEPGPKEKLVGLIGIIPLNRILFKCCICFLFV